MSLDPHSAHSRSRSPSPAPHTNSHAHERRASTPGLRPSNAPSATPSPSASPAMLPQGLGINHMEVDWDPLPESHDHTQGTHSHHDRYRLTGRKGYNALHAPPTPEASPSRGHHHSHSGEHHHHHHETGLAPPHGPEHLTPLPPSPAPSHHGGYGGRKGYNANPEVVPFSPVEVAADSSPLRPRDHSCGTFGRKGYNSAPRSLSPP